MKDGVDGVVVDKPNRLVEEAKKGVSALAVQDRYPSGEAATSLLRQIRVARAEAVPAIVLLTGDIPQGDRLVLEKQYKVKEFIRIAENPIRIAQAVGAAAGGSGAPSPVNGNGHGGNGAGAHGAGAGTLVEPSDEGEVILHPDEEKNAFDISVESVNSQIENALDDGFDDEGDSAEPKTVEVSSADLRRLREDNAEPKTISEPNKHKQEPITAPTGVAAATPVGTGGGASGHAAAPAPAGAAGMRKSPHPVTQEAAPSDDFILDNPTSEGGLLDLSQLPPPGGEADVEFLQAQQTSVQNRPAASPSPISVLAPPDPGEAALLTKAENEGEPVQTQQQDFQKAQNELKKALIAERKQREAAQKRVEELEAKLAKVGDIAPKMTGGVPSEGVFEDIRYPALLARCRAEAFTGAIQMQSGGATRNVYLKDGLPVAFHSSEPGERIGKVLVTQGRISDAQYMQATTRSVERSIKLTDALVELGWMDAETIAVEQRNLARDQIIQSFELVQGRFTVATGTAPDANTATFDFGPGEIYVQGYRRYAPSSEMMAAYETLRDKYLIANARLASYRPKLGLTGEDERLLRLLGEALTIEEAVERAQVPAEAAARLLSALQALELVEEWSPGVEQFRSRIRGEKQRHAEEISGIMAEARQREQRLLDAFEKALSKMGAGSLSAHLDASEPAVKPGVGSASASATKSTAPSFGASSPSPSPGLGGRSPTSSQPTMGVGSPSAPANNFVHSSTASAGVVVAPQPSPPSPPSSPPMSMGVGESVTVAPAGANGPAVGAGASAKAKESSTTLSVADLKYREGVEQAAQNRLDEAEVTLREAVRLDASKPEYLTSLARVLLANPRYERAGTLPVVRSLLDRAVQIAPDFQEAVDLHNQVMKEMAS